MKHYPSIPKEINSNIDIFAFDKLDGSNIRAEWSKKRGFYKFGTKTQMLGEDHPVFGKAIGLIKSTYDENLSKVFTDAKVESAVSFFEFYSPSSNFGRHDPEDKNHKVTLLDVNYHRKGMMEPNEFIDTFGYLDIPAVLYWGKANKIFEEQVRDSTLDGMTFEGVICKAKAPRKGDRKSPAPVMFKIKSRAWLEKLREFCKGDEKLFEELS